VKSAEREAWSWLLGLFFADDYIRTMEIYIFYQFAGFMLQF